MTDPLEDVDGEDAQLCPKERAELERQGAKAAARGDAAGTNPMKAQQNLPAATGEPFDAWSIRRDAWLAGFDAQPVRR